MEKVTLYQAVWIDKTGGFRVTNSVGRTEDETIQLSRKHYAVKAGAKLHYIDSWEEWIGEYYYKNTY